MISDETTESLIRIWHGLDTLYSGSNIKERECVTISVATHARTKCLFVSGYENTFSSALSSRIIFF